jgi:hypothetical protein
LRLSLMALISNLVYRLISFSRRSSHGQ